MHIFGWWEGARVPGENPRIHGKNMHTQVVFLDFLELLNPLNACRGAISDFLHIVSVYTSVMIAKAKFEMIPLMHNISHYSDRRDLSWWQIKMVLFLLTRICTI